MPMGFDFTEQTPSGSVPGQPVSPSFGMAPIQARAERNAAIADLVGAGAKIVQLHVEREKENEVRTDAAALGAFANSQARSLAVELQAAPDADTAARIVEEHKTAMREYASGRDATGVPNLRWKESRQRYERAVKLFDAQAEAMSKQHLVKLARQNNLAKLDLARHNLIEDSYTGYVDDTVRELPDDYVQSVRSWVDAWGSVVGAPADVRRKRFYDLLGEIQEYRVRESIDAGTAEDAERIRTALGEAVYDGLSDRRRTDLALYAKNVAEARKRDAERKAAKAAKALADHARAGVGEVFLGSVTTEDAVKRLGRAREADAMTEYEYVNLLRALQAKEATDNDDLSVAAASRVVLRMSAGTIDRRTAAESIAALLPNMTTAHRAKYAGIAAADAQRALKHKYAEAERIIAGYDKDGFFGNREYDDKGRDVTHKNRALEVQALREKFKDPVLFRKEREKLLDKWHEEDKLYLLVLRTIENRLEQPDGADVDVDEAIRRTMAHPAQARIFDEAVEALKR